MIRVVSLLVLLCTSCEAPALQARGEMCEVSMPASLGEERARALANEVDALIPRAARLLSMPPPSLVRVKVIDKVYVTDVHDTYGALQVDSGPVVLLGAVNLEKPGLLYYALGHELAHWLMYGTAWMNTPYLIQEAMADFVGTLFSPGAREARQMQIEELGIVGDKSVLSLTLQDLDRMPHEEQQRACLSALILASQIGFDRLPLLVRDGKPLFDDD